LIVTVYLNFCYLPTMTRFGFPIVGLVLVVCCGHAAGTCETGADGACAAPTNSNEVTVLLQGALKVDEELAPASSKKTKIKVSDADWIESGGDAKVHDDSCGWPKDGSCDAPTYCRAGTDCTDCGDCGGGGGGGGASSDSGISANDWELLGGGSVKYTDIQQGALGDCYFLAALSAIAFTHPEIIKSMFTKGSLLEGANPVYTTKWLLNGKPTTFAVNNKIPATPSSGIPYFVQEKGGNYWPLVLEKTWAKLFGDYKTIESGLQSEVFKAITQAPVNVYSHNKVVSWQDKENFWNKLVAGTSNKFPMGAITPGTPPGNIGVMGGHAYAVLGAYQYGGFPRALKLYNPHHKDKYKGVIPNSEKTDGSFFLTLDEFLNSYSTSMIAHVVSGAKLSHKVIQKDTTMVLEFTMTSDAAFAVQLEWASKRLLKGCGYQNPKFVMLVAKADNLQSAIVATKQSSQRTNAAAHMPGGYGKYYIFVRGTFPTVTVLQEMVVNIYGTEAPTIDVSSQYSDPLDLFLAMKGLCKTIAVAGTGKWGGAAKYKMDRNTHVNAVPVWMATTGQIEGYEVVAWSGEKLVMSSSVDEARQGTIYRSVDVTNPTCADSLIQEIKVTESKKSLVELHTVALAAEKMEDVDVDASFEELSSSSESAYSTEGCNSAVARLQTLDQGDQIATGGYDAVFPEISSSIAPYGANCGDSAIGQSLSCDTYNHWLSIKKMKKLATDFKSNLEGGCVQKAPFNGKCMIDTTLCSTTMSVQCASGGYTFPVGQRFGDLTMDFCDPCTTTAV